MKSSAKKPLPIALPRPKPGEFAYYDDSRRSGHGTRDARGFDRSRERHRASDAERHGPPTRATCAAQQHASRRPDAQSEEVLTRVFRARRFLYSLTTAGLHQDAISTFPEQLPRDHESLNVLRVRKVAGIKAAGSVHVAVDALRALDAQRVNLTAEPGELLASQLPGRVGIARRVHDDILGRRLGEDARGEF